MCLGYVDDTALVAAGGSFNETHWMLGSMMSRPEGVNKWTVSHNSRFEALKSVLVDYSHAKHIERPVMKLRGSPITLQPSHKFLGVIIDQDLCWNSQHDHALAKATKWVLAFHYLAWLVSGANLHVGLWLVHLMLRQVCYRAALRLASLPEAHPLHAVFHKRTKWYIKTHRSPLHEIAALYSSAPEELETCGPVHPPPASTTKAKITVGGANDSEEVVPLEDDEVQLFSDRSGLDSKVGAAAVLYKCGQGPRMLRYSLGSLEEHMVFKPQGQSDRPGPGTAHAEV